MVKRKSSNMSPTRKRRPGVNLAGLAASLALFAALVALGHWVDARTQGASPAAHRNTDPTSHAARHAALPAAGRVEARDVLTLAQPGDQEPVSEPATESEVIQTPAREPARTESAFSNEVYSAPARPRKKTPAPAPARPARVTFAPVSSPAPAVASVKPPAQNNPAIKPSLSKPTASDTSLPDRVVRVAPPKTPASAEPFYSVRLNKADSKYLADVVADTLKEHGFDDSRVVPTSDGKYTVTVGDYNFRYAAENAKQQLKDLGFNETFIDEKTVAE